MTRPVIELLSSGDFQPSAADADRAALARVSGGDGRVLVLLTALAPAAELDATREGQRAVDHFRRLGVAAHVLPVATRDDAFRADIAAAVAGASMVFLAGGRPEYLATTLAETPLWAAIEAAGRRGTAVAGCSAGMWALGELVPIATATTLAEHGWVPGLRLVPGSVLAAHWDALDGFVPGLQRAVANAVPADWTLLALEERTAVVGDGREWTVYGAGAALVRRGGSARVYRRGDRFTI